MALRSTPRTVARAARARARFDPALTWRGRGADRRRATCPAMTARPLIALTASAALAAAGCGSSSSSSSTAPNPNAKEHSPPGDIPDNQAYVRYAAPSTAYSVKVPEGWSRTSSGRVVSFTDKLNTVRLGQRAAAAAPTLAAARRAAPAKATVTTVHRAGQPGVRITYLAQGRSDPVTGKSRLDAVERYLFFHNGHEAVLTLSGPKGADNVDPWRIITDSLRWTR